MKSLLEQTRVAFEQWRSLGKSRGYATQELKDMALGLLNYYSHKEVSLAAGVSINTVKNWNKKNAFGESAASPTFIPVTLPKQKQEPLSDPFLQKLKLHLPNKFELIIPEQSIEKTKNLISALVKEFN